MERCTIIRSEQVRLEIPGLDTNTAEPQRCEFLMKALRDT